jgi:hypothetical protein
MYDPKEQILKGHLHLYSEQGRHTKDEGNVVNNESTKKSAETVVILSIAARGFGP